MSTIAVTSTPQAIYPDGDNDSFIIFNKGPFRVYVDDNSSINTDSMVILPQGYLAWDANRPLWVRTVDPLGAGFLANPSPTSTILITRNTQIPTINANTYTQIANVTDVLTAANSYQFIVPFFDVSAYQSIQIRIRSATYQQGTGVGMDASKAFAGEIIWFDDSLTPVGSETFVCPAPTPSSSIGGVLTYGGTANQTSKITFPVRGSYALVYGYASATTGSYPYQLQVLGATIPLSRSMSFTPDDNVFSESSSIGVGLVSGLGWGSDALSFDWAELGYPGIVLPKRGTRYSITISTSATVGTAGLIIVGYSYRPSIKHCQNISIPAAPAGNSVTTEVDIPVYIPTTLRISTIPKDGGGVNIAQFIYLSIQCLDPVNT